MSKLILKLYQKCHQKSHCFLTNGSLIWFLLFIPFIYRSNHSGNNGSSGSLPSSGIGGNGVSSLNSDETNNSEYLNNNNNSAENGAGAEICDVPYEVANQKRHVSFKFNKRNQSQNLKRNALILIQTAHNFFKSI